MRPRPGPARNSATGPGDRRIRRARRSCGKPLPAPTPTGRCPRSKAEPIASWTTPRLRPPRLFLVLIAVQALVLLEVLAGVFQLLRSLLRIDVAVGAGFLRRLRVFRLAVRRRRADQETAQQNDSGHCEFQMGHELISRSQVCNCIATHGTAAI